MARKIPAVSLFWPRPLPDPGAPAAPSQPPPQKKTPNPASCDENQPSPSPNSAAQQQAVFSSARRGRVAPRLPGGRRSEPGPGCGGHVAERAGGGGRGGAALLQGAAQLGPCLRLQEPAEENAAQEEKFWYDSPALGSKMMYEPTKLTSVVKGDHTKTRKEDTIRCRVLNNLIHKAVSEMMSTGEVNQELYDLKLEICKVSLASNFSACRVYWNPAAITENESYVESLLQKSAPRIRYLLMSQQILGNVPPIVFVKDKEAAAVKKVEELLSIADFGPEEEKVLSQNDSSESFSSATQSSDSPMRSNLFGIDHELLNKQIMDYKRLKVSRDTEGICRTQKQEQQLSKIQKKMKKKKMRNPPDDDITPQKYLMDRSEADYLDDNNDAISDYEIEDELQEGVNELEAGDGETQSQPPVKLK
ncbi:putative ribosome-binding factor A, mitochondrial isoform X1 [Anas acuta]|uniref:putative ribosome-binding factor A, mitochondrial isoform X1 n=2 Tax=Anas acuta TaxID=28680 RepID=UPI0035C91E58